VSNNYDPVTEAGMESFPASDPPSFTATSGTGSRNPRKAMPEASREIRALFREVDLAALPPIGHTHLALLEAQQFVARAMEEWAAHRTDLDTSTVLGRLSTLRADLTEHRHSVAAEGSLSRLITFEGPWLLSELQHLFDHHDRLDAALEGASAEYESAVEPRAAGARLFRHLRGIGAALDTLLAVEHSLLMDQFCEPPAHD